MTPKKIKPSDVVPFEEKAIKEYLDNAIRRWRKKLAISCDSTKLEPIAYIDVDGLERDKLIARCYIDAFQSVRMSLFDEFLPLTNGKK
jgi:hypothetical protein